MSGEARRSYDRTGRRARADELTFRILDVVLEMVQGLDAPDITLEAAAVAAEVSVQSVVRRFGSKDGLYAAAFARARTHYRPSRTALSADDLATSIVRAQLEIYERWGKALLYLQTQENERPRVARELEIGRRERRLWLAGVLSERLRRCRRREDMLAQIFTLTDVHAWAAFRLTQRMSRRRTEANMADLLRTRLARVADEGDDV